MLNCLNYNTAAERCRQEIVQSNIDAPQYCPYFDREMRCKFSLFHPLCSEEPANTPAKHIQKNRELIAEVIFNWGTHFPFPSQTVYMSQCNFPFSQAWNLSKHYYMRLLGKWLRSKYEIYHSRHLHNIERMVSFHLLRDLHGSFKREHKLMFLITVYFLQLIIWKAGIFMIFFLSF